jgi:filamentous hemagglutinin
VTPSDGVVETSEAAFIVGETFIGAASGYDLAVSAWTLADAAFGVTAATGEVAAAGTTAATVTAATSASDSILNETATATAEATEAGAVNAASSAASAGTDAATAAVTAGAEAATTAAADTASASTTAATTDAATAATTEDSLTAQQQRAISKINNVIADHLQPGPTGDIAGTVSDMVGNPIPHPEGGYYDHVGEMNDTLRSLYNNSDILEDVDHPAAQAAYENAINAIIQIEEATQGLGI